MIHAPLKIIPAMIFYQQITVLSRLRKATVLSYVLKQPSLLLRHKSLSNFALLQGRCNTDVQSTGSSKVYSISSSDVPRKASPVVTLQIVYMGGLPIVKSKETVF